MTNPIRFLEATDAPEPRGGGRDVAGLRLDPSRRTVLRFQITLEGEDEMEALRYARRAMIREERTRGLEWDEPSMEDPTLAGSEIRLVLPGDAGGVVPAEDGRVDRRGPIERLEELRKSGRLRSVTPGNVPGPISPRGPMARYAPKPLPPHDYGRPVSRHAVRYLGTVHATPIAITEIGDAPGSVARSGDSTAAAARRRPPARCASACPPTPDSLEALRYARRSMLREEWTRGIEEGEPSLEEAIFSAFEVVWSVPGRRARALPGEAHGARRARQPGARGAGAPSALLALALARPYNCVDERS